MSGFKKQHTLDDNSSPFNNIDVIDEAQLMQEMMSCKSDRRGGLLTCTSCSLHLQQNPSLSHALQNTHSHARVGEGRAA